MFRGAPTRMILAELPPYQVRNLFLNFSKEIADANLGTSWAEFREKLRAIRRAGYCISGEIDKRLIGVAAPIFRAPSAVIGSFCVVRLKKLVKDGDLEVMTDIAVEAARQITKGIATFTPQGNRREPHNFPAPRVGR